MLLLPKKSNEPGCIFYSNGSGFIKMNEKFYELKRKIKGVNEAIFAGNRYEAILTIDG